MYMTGFWNNMSSIDVEDVGVHFGDFKPVEAEEGGYTGEGALVIHYWYMFDNGYGASVIRNDFSYGGGDGLFEVAVINSSREIVYDTPITDDVLGYLTEDEVVEVLKDIKALPKAKE